MFFIVKDRLCGVDLVSGQCGCVTGFTMVEAPYAQRTSTLFAESGPVYLRRFLEAFVSL